jgi:hypothetical protein
MQTRFCAKRQPWAELVDDDFLLLAKASSNGKLLRAAT